MNPRLVFVFGDSIAWGLWDQRGGWAARLWDGNARTVYNLGVDGETSEDVSKRFSPEATARGANRKSIIIFAVGINDSSRINNSNRVSLPSYMRNMNDLIDRAREKFTDKILCLGLAPIDQSKTVPFILEKTISFFTSDQREYDSALETVCNRKEAEYISLRNSSLEHHLSNDGVHPSFSGHAIIAEKVLGAVTRLG